MTPLSLGSSTADRPSVPSKRPPRDTRAAQPSLRPTAHRLGSVGLYARVPLGRQKCPESAVRGRRIRVWRLGGIWRIIECRTA